MGASSPAPSYVYGPVPSRRLGRSLGVDLIPLKTCSYDCVYCQLGPTTLKTVERKAWVDPAAVLEQVRDRLVSRPGVIAMAGSGEPTLHSGIGDVVRGIKEMTDVPVVVITNGSLLHLPEVRADLAAADIVVPSLDAPDEALFREVNRPHSDLRLSAIVEGLVEFREMYDGEIWLEIMLLGGVTGLPDVVDRLAAAALRFAPDRIQLNTAVRPPAESSVRRVPQDEMEALATRFTPLAEVISRAPVMAEIGNATTEEVLALLSRRPCTVEDIAAGLGIHHGEALKLATVLVDTGAAEMTAHEGGRFYAPATYTHDRFAEEKA